MNVVCNLFPAELDEHEKCEDDFCSESFATFPHWFDDLWNLDTNFGLIRGGTLVRWLSRVVWVAFSLSTVLMC